MSDGYYVDAVNEIAGLIEGEIGSHVDVSEMRWEIEQDLRELVQGYVDAFGDDTLYGDTPHVGGGPKKPK